MVFWSRGKKARELMDRGFKLLDDEDYPAALETGEKLISLNHSSGYEIKALALDGLSRRPEAIAILEEGVSKAPQVWLLWQLLGNYRSDACEYEKAHGAYRVALTCPDVIEEDVNFNRAIAHYRAGEGEKALELIPTILSEAHAIALIEMEVDCHLAGC